MAKPVKLLKIPPFDGPVRRGRFKDLGSKQKEIHLCKTTKMEMCKKKKKKRSGAVWLFFSQSLLLCLYAQELQYKCECVVS